MSKKNCCVLTPKPSTHFLIHKSSFPSIAMCLADETIPPNTSIAQLPQCGSSSAQLPQCNSFVAQLSRCSFLQLNFHSVVLLQLNCHIVVHI